MSTFQPGLEPPSSWRHQPPPPPPGPTPTTTGAASMVWLCSAMGMLLSTCCLCGAVSMVIVPRDELIRQMPPGSYNDQMIQMLPAIAVGMGVFGVVMMLIPAIVLAVLGFKVRDGGRGGTIAAMIVLGIQGITLGMILLFSLPGLVMQFTIANLGVVLMEAGSVLVIGGTMVSLYKALTERRTGTGNPSRVEPWG